MRRRVLALRREVLDEITTDELGSVVAGALPSGLTCPALGCVSGGVCTLTAQPRCGTP
ncbi:MAG TPA: hypothetical protein VGX28_01520 [Frankiaceae bacterium]|jgi:hypothetical protein|nr:hypothetical protein [Frankiaceae bacterium]